MALANMHLTTHNKNYAEQRYDENIELKNVNNCHEYCLYHQLCIFHTKWFTFHDECGCVMKKSVYQGDSVIQSAILEI